MRARWPVLGILALLLGATACGYYGPPVRSSLPQVSSPAAQADEECEEEAKP